MKKKRENGRGLIDRWIREEDIAAVPVDELDEEARLALALREVERRPLPSLSREESARIRLGVLARVRRPGERQRTMWRLAASLLMVATLVGLIGLWRLGRKPAAEPGVETKAMGAGGEKQVRFVLQTDDVNVRLLLSVPSPTGTEVGR